MKGMNIDRRFFVPQADGILNQANPVPGTEYPIAALAGLQFVRIYSIMTNVTWTVQPSPLECHIIADGITYRYAFANPVSGTAYFAQMWPPGAANGQTLVVSSIATIYRAFLHDFRDLTSITFEVTGGTSNPLEARVKWALLR